MKRSIVAISMAALTVAGLGIGSAEAAKPVNTGCYGEIISAITSTRGSSRRIR